MYAPFWTVLYIFVRSAANPGAELRTCADMVHRIASIKPVQCKAQQAWWSSSGKRREGVARVLRIHRIETNHIPSSNNAVHSLHTPNASTGYRHVEP